MATSQRMAWHHGSSWCQYNMAKEKRQCCSYTRNNRSEMTVKFEGSHAAKETHNLRVSWLEFMLVYETIKDRVFKVVCVIIFSPLQKPTGGNLTSYATLPLKPKMEFIGSIQVEPKHTHAPWPDTGEMSREQWAVLGLAAL